MWSLRCVDPDLQVAVAGSNNMKVGRKPSDLDFQLYRAKLPRFIALAMPSQRALLTKKCDLKRRRQHPIRHARALPTAGQRAEPQQPRASDSHCGSHRNRNCCLSRDSPAPRLMECVHTEEQLFPGPEWCVVKGTPLGLTKAWLKRASAAGLIAEAKAFSL